jgi:hypothetical protein
MVPAAGTAGRADMEAAVVMADILSAVLHDARVNEPTARFKRASLYESV